MAKADTKTEEPVVDENDSVVEEPTVELDKPTEIEGDLVENPVLEETDEKTEEAVEKPVADEDTGDTGEETADDKSEPDEATDTEADVVEEKDETGVYAPAEVKDPGEFQPNGDYGFEVTTLDGKTIKISTPEQAEAFADRLDSEENLLSARQFMEFTRKVSRMDNGIEREKSQFETEKQTFETQQAQDKVRNEQITQWSNELNYLQAKGLLPEIPAKVDVPGGWEKNPDDPGVKARLEIFKWMQQENTDRRTAGIAEVTSAVDAYRLMQADSTVQTEKQETNTERTTRQSKGKMVSGNSSFTDANEQSGSIIGEGGSLRDLVTEFSASQ